jgi:hypothetical protein
MNTLGASIYINFVGMERFDDQRFKNEELNKWIQDNVDILNCHYAKISKRRHYLAGVYLYPEQATLFKLKFEL